MAPLIWVVWDINRVDSPELSVWSKNIIPPRFIAGGIFCSNQFTNLLKTTRKKKVIELLQLNEWLKMIRDWFKKDKDNDDWFNHPFAIF